MIQAELLTFFQLISRPRCADDGHAAGFRKLQRGEPDAGTDGVDQQGLARFQISEREYRVVSGDECFRNRGGFGETEIAGSMCEKSLVD